MYLGHKRCTSSWYGFHADSSFSPARLYPTNFNHDNRECGYSAETLNLFASTLLNDSKTSLQGLLPASRADLQKLLELIAGLKSFVSAAEARFAQQDERIASLESRLDLLKVYILTRSLRRRYQVVRRPQPCIIHADQCHAC